MKAQRYSPSPPNLVQIVRSRKWCRKWFLSLDLFKSSVPSNGSSTKLLTGKKGAFCLVSGHKFQQRAFPSVCSWLLLFFLCHWEFRCTWCFQKRQETQGHTHYDTVVGVSLWGDQACISQYSVFWHICVFLYGSCFVINHKLLSTKEMVSLWKISSNILILKHGENAIK